MSKRQKKKAQVAEEEPEVKVITRLEIIYEDTKATTGVELDYKWGEIFRMISNQNVPDAGFEEMKIYANIEKSALMKVATRPKLFPCSEVICWILPKEDVTRMILENTAKQGHVAYNIAYVSMAYHIPSPHAYLKESWLKEMDLDLVETVKWMMIPGKIFRTKPSREHDTSTLCAPYRFISLMLNRIFGRAHGKSFNIGWIPVIFFVATQGTIFNSSSIVSNSLSMCISATLGGIS